MGPTQLNELVRGTNILNRSFRFYIVVGINYPNVNLLELDDDLTLDVTRQITLHDDGVYRDNSIGISDMLYEFLGPSPIKYLDLLSHNEGYESINRSSPRSPVASPRSPRSPMASPRSPAREGLPLPSVRSPRSPVASPRSPVSSPRLDPQQEIGPVFACQLCTVPFPAYRSNLTSSSL